MERYELCAGRYVLYVAGVRALQTDVVALLFDARGGRLLTHGDPASVRRECDALRAMGGCNGLVLIEGEPALAALNGAVSGRLALQDLHVAFSEAAAERLTQSLLTRLSQPRMT
jgi:hypothetical protein